MFPIAAGSVRQLALLLFIILFRSTTALFTLKGLKYTESDKDECRGLIDSNRNPVKTMV